MQRFGTWRGIAATVVGLVLASCSSNAGENQRLDSEIPHWPADAALTVFAFKGTEASLIWPAAFDDTRVVAYRVFRDDEEVTTVSGGWRTLQVALPNESQVFRVEALDQPGKQSVDGPSVVVLRTLVADVGWPADAAVSVTETDLGYALNWTPAVGAGGYRVYVDNQPFMDSQEREVLLDALVEGRSYVIRVEAAFAGLGWTNNGPRLGLSVPDRQGPLWPDDAELLVSNVIDTGLTAAWPSAVESHSTVFYRVQVGDLDAVEQTETFLEVSALVAATEVVISVVAVDADGNAGTALVGTFETVDTLPPVWGADAHLQPSNAEVGSVNVAWTEANDSVGVVAYRVFVDEVLTETLSGDLLETNVTGLDGAPSLLRVEAEDDAGNRSTDGPSLLVDLSDETPPTWPVAATASVLAAATSIEVSWPAASDDVGLSGYEIQVGDAVVHTGPGQGAATVSGLSPLTEYLVSVMATDSAANVSIALTVNVTTTDYLPPVWAADAAIELVASTPTSLSLGWTPIAADQLAVEYRVRVDGEHVQTIDVSSPIAQLASLTADTSYVVELQAAGPTGLVSTNGPSLTVVTAPDEPEPDVTPPGWSGGTTVTVVSLTATSADLSWPAAIDDTAVVDYRVLLDGQIHATTGGATSATLDGLTSSTGYNVVIRAGDSAGNWSSSGPATLLTTPPGSQSGLSDADVYAGLQPHCGVCHSGAGDLFGNLSDFQSNLVASSLLITPGAPEDSLFFLYLTANASGPFGQMPPSFAGVGSFLDLQSQGLTTITVDQIEQWIITMGELP